MCECLIYIIDDYKHENIIIKYEFIWLRKM